MGGSDLPTGTVAFLFTDIEQSTQLPRALGGEYSHLIAEHHRLLSEAFEANSGRVVDEQGDSLFAVFSASSRCGCRGGAGSEEPRGSRLAR
jgi:class 3 adenylate cyclase